MKSREITKRIKEIAELIVLACDHKLYGEIKRLAEQKSKLEKKLENLR